MKNILVPTDFSETSKNAAHYAMHLAEQTGAQRIILFNAYQAPVYYDPMVPAVQLIDESELREASIQQLNKFRMTLLAFCPKNCLMDIYCEYGLLHQGLDEVCQRTESDIIVMGITGGGMIEEKLIGSNTIAVVHNSSYPVIIVPSKANFTTINNLMLLCDFEKADTSIPVVPIRQFKNKTGAKLLVFNNRPGAMGAGNELPAKVLSESYAVHTVLQDMDPEYHYAANNDFLDSVHSFALEKQVDLIISISKPHGFFESLFKESHTKKLAFHSHLPIMAIRAVE
jgi:nucleotide-binding universal stress UspA family protein